MLKTCATIVTTEKGKPRRPTHVNTKTKAITQAACAKTATWQNTI